MSKIISGSDAMKMLGINTKKMSAGDALKKFKITPIYTSGGAIRTKYFVKEEDVIEVAEKLYRVKKLPNPNIAQHGEKTRYIPTNAVLDKINELEQKIDILISLWKS